MLHVSDSWSKAFDQGKYVGAVFLDVAKAFDCINHNILLSKLPFYGVDGNILNWFKSYLSNCQKFVRIGSDVSAWSSVTIGVPQGSILGPILFQLYINDLPTVVKYSDINIYADDTEIHYCSDQINDLHVKIQSDLDRINDWLNCNCLLGNSDKTVAMLAGPRRRVINKELNVFLNAKKLVCVDKVKYLGVILDRFLSWEDHILDIIHSARYKVFTLCRLKPLPPDLLIRLYKVYVIPVYDYSCVVYNSCSSTLSQKLDKSHRHSLNILIQNLQYFHHLILQSVVNIS